MTYRVVFSTFSLKSMNKYYIFIGGVVNTPKLLIYQKKEEKKNG